jgi:hypothetical protein
MAQHGQSAATDIPPVLLGQAHVAHTLNDETSSFGIPIHGPWYSGRNVLGLPMEPAVHVHVVLTGVHKLQ